MYWVGQEVCSGLPYLTEKPKRVFGQPNRISTTVTWKL